MHKAYVGDRAQTTSPGFEYGAQVEQKPHEVGMTKTLPVQKHSAQNNFFNNFVVESVDQNGRTSLRQIVSTDPQGRTSILHNPTTS